MTKSSETDEYQANSILDGFDLIAMAMLIGIILFILGTPASWGATSPLDPGARVSGATNSGLFERLERPMRETIGKASRNLNLEKEVADRTLPQVSEITRIEGNRSENEIRADEISIRLLAPWH